MKQEAIRKIEQGLKAKCWFCDKTFTKKKYCKKCGFYKCPYCGKCGCDLNEFERKIIRYTIEALYPRIAKKTENNMG